MKSIILAAGLGTRLRPITERKAKCMVNVAGKSILQHQIEAYLAAGIEEVIVVAGYMGEPVEYFCSKYKQVSVIQNPDFATTNNMYSLSLALKTGDFSTGFILSNGDVVYDPEIIQQLANAPGSLIVSEKDSYTLESMKIIVEEERITDISKQVKETEAYGNSIDLYKFDEHTAQPFIDTVEQSLKTNTNEWAEVALQRAIQTNVITMAPFDIAGRDWVEIDNYDDLADADFRFSNYKKVLANASAWFVDLDGTLYLGEGKIAGADGFIEVLKEKKPFYLYSNNSSRNKTQYVEKLLQHGIEVEEKNILLSTDGMISFLKQKDIRNVFVLGTKALSDWLIAEGFGLEETDPDCVVVGYDTELTYQKLQTAAELINKGVPYYATHPDVVCPTTKGPIPDIGSIIAMLQTTTGEAPVEVFGKPGKAMVESIINKHGWQAEQIIFIGDRIYTDQVMADNINAQFILVLSGETNREDVETSNRPDVIVPSVATLTKALQKT